MSVSKKKAEEVALFVEEGIPPFQIPLPSEGEAEFLLFIRALPSKLANEVMEDSLSPEAEFLLFTVARAQLVSEVIKPNLDLGTWVISDRYTPSSEAYQGYGRGLSLDFIRTVNSGATRGVSPDLIILLDVPVTEGIRRVFRRGKGWRRIEMEEEDFHERVRRGYKEMAKADPARWVVMDGLQPPKMLADQIWERVRSSLVLLDDRHESQGVVAEVENMHWKPSPPVQLSLENKPDL
jgi:dTMP kinase